MNDHTPPPPPTSGNLRLRTSRTAPRPAPARCPARRTRRSAARSPRSTAHRGPPPRGDGAPPGSRVACAGAPGRAGPPRSSPAHRHARTHQSPLPPVPQTAAPPPPARPTAGDWSPRSADGWSARRRSRDDACRPLRAPSADGRSRPASPSPRPPRPDRDRARRRPPAQRPAHRAAPALTRCASCHEPHDPPRPDAAPAAFQSLPSLLPQTLSSSNSLIEDYLHPTRRDRRPRCDSAGHLGTAAARDDRGLNQRAASTAAASGASASSEARPSVRSCARQSAGNATGAGPKLTHTRRRSSAAARS
jgi:hypothetical protein